MQVMRPHCWGASPRQLCAGGTSKQGVAWRNLRPERTPRRRPCGADAVGQQALAHPWLVPFGPILVVFFCGWLPSQRGCGCARVRRPPPGHGSRCERASPGRRAGTTHRAPGERRGCGPTNHHRPCIQGLRRCTRAGAGVGAPGRGQASHFGAHRPVGGRVGRLPAHRGGRDFRHHGAVGVGQIDPGAPAQPPDRAHQRAHPDRRARHPPAQRRRLAGAAAQRHLHGVPVVCAHAAHDGVAKHRFWPGAGGRGPCHARTRCAGGAGASGLGRLGRELPRRAVGRDAAARGAGAGLGRRSGHFADG